LPHKPDGISPLITPTIMNNTPDNLSSRRDFSRTPPPPWRPADWPLRSAFRRFSRPLSHGKIKIGFIGCAAPGSGAANQALTADSDVRPLSMGDAFRRQDPDEPGKLDEMHEAKIDVPKERQFVGLDATKRSSTAAWTSSSAPPPAFRPIHFKAAVAAGKHCFLEKPMATTARLSFHPRNRGGVEAQEPRRPAPASAGAIIPACARPSSG